MNSGIRSSCRIIVHRHSGLQTVQQNTSHHGFLAFRGKRTAAAGSGSKKGGASSSRIGRRAPSNRDGGGGRGAAREIARSQRMSNSRAGGGGERYVFGLRPVNYGRAPPPEICLSPPPPPPKKGFGKYIFPASMVVTLGLTAYFYVNNQNDSYAYWEAMQTGGTIFEDDDEDDEVDDA